MNASLPPSGDFLLATCQGGAEAALAARQAVAVPGLARAAWRRGVVTFRRQPGAGPLSHAERSGLVFARTLVHSLGQVTGPDVGSLVRALHELAGPQRWGDIHVWPREPRVEGDPATLRAAIVAGLDVDRRGSLPAAGLPTPPGALVLDCAIDGPDRWWVGWHVADTPSGTWPGGIYPQGLPAGKVSRAWLKLDEAIATFALDLAPGERAVELGAAPGGACQRLLEAGLIVTGVDPALVDDQVARHPQFEQWRMRARDVKLKGFRGFDWVVADMNIDPTSTLEAIGRVVTAPGTFPRGIIATLKMPNWARAAELPAWLAQFSGWGYATRARQLSTGGREICVVAERAAVSRRPPRATRRPGR
jgi:23S rRNA (cytidine2498-2'-O)-methyltransferase